MSKKVKESLHELIKSLTKSEKRYFKLMSARHTIGDENNYVILFDFIEKQSEYDETEIFKYFKGNAFLNKFSITKKRLYDQLLNSLDAFHKSSSLEAQIFQLIHSADILNRKSLYEQSKSILRSAEKLAEKNQLFNLQLLIKRKQKKLLENDSYETVSKEELSVIYKQGKILHSKSLLYDKLWFYKSRLFQLLSSKGDAISKDELEDFKIIFDELIHQIKEEELYFEVSYLIQHIYSAYYFAINDYSACLNHLNQNTLHFESDQMKMIEFPNKYFSILTNAIFVSEKLGYLQESTQFFNKLKLFQEKCKNSGSEDLNIKLFSSVSSIELNTLINKGDFHSALKILPGIESKLIHYHEKLASPRKMYFAFKIAVVYIGVNDFSNALKWINYIINNQQFDQNESIFSYTQLLNLIVHLEMGHVDLLPYLVKNAQRFFKSKKRIGSFESGLFSFVNKLLKQKDEVNKNVLWSEYYEEVKGYKQEVFFDYFDLIAWSKSKGFHQKYDEVIQDKFRLNNKKATTI